MVVGRLNRESNPVPGEKPGFKPQHKLPDGSFIDTGEINPLPTKDDLAYQQLDSLKQLINDQQTLTKKVEVTNQKATQSVDGMVGVDNFPIDYPDSGALTELQTLKNKQSEATAGIQTLVTNQGTVNNFPVEQKVSDSDVLTKLSELDSKMDGVIDGSTPANTKLVGAVSDNMLTELKRISGSFGAEDLWDTPGNQKLVEGDKDAGFFGFVTAADFINGDDLAAAIGLSAGSSQFTNTPWIKYMWKGKVCFTPLKTIRYGVDWDSIYNVGAIYASGDEGTLPPEGRLGTELTVDATDNSINTTEHFLGDKTPTTDQYDTVGTVGETIVLDGWANVDNNGEFVIDSITDTKIVVSGGILVAEVGDRTNRLYPKANAVTQNTFINLKGFDFNVRLFNGASNDPLNSYTDPDRDSVGDKNEWNNIILPLHERAESQNWNFPNYTGTTENWRMYLSDADLMTHNQFANGSYSWCQEVRDGTQTFRRVGRGYNGASYLSADYSWNASSRIGWRPVLQLS